MRMRPLAAVVGLAGPALLPGERAMLRALPPTGIILFARNVVDPAQLRALTAELRQILPDILILVDQEGGRVARMRPPHWRDHPPAGAIGALFERAPHAGLRVAWLTGALIGLDCRDAGIDVACAPVLDRRLPGADLVIGDRSYGEAAHAVARLGRAMASGLLAAGVQPVGKHVPGHGGAGVDSHLELPVVAEGDPDADLLPFALNTDLPWMMTAHILYPELDAEYPATLSAQIIGQVIRGELGFTGVLVSDDLAMEALQGPPGQRAAAALAAGCDLAMYCPGDAAGTQAVLGAVPEIPVATALRLSQAATLAHDRRLALDGEALQAERSELSP